MDQSLLDLAHLEETQLFNPFDDLMKTIDSISFQDEATVETKKESTADFVLPINIPDDENDDFSWLFKVLSPSKPAQSDQTVPSGDSPCFKQTTQQINEVPPLEQSMLLDSMLSEMDVTSLILHNETGGNESSVMTFHKGPEGQDEKSQESLTNHRKKAVRRSGRVTRPPPRLLNSLLTETPVSVGRSLRKRSYQQMIDAEVKNTKLQTVAVSKRRRMQPKQRYESTPITTELATGETWTTTPVSTHELKIVFRRHKPVNPIDKKLVKGYNRGLLYSGKTPAAELYLKHTLTPQMVPPKQNPSIMVENSLSIRKVQDLLRKEWMENRNTIANGKAHGKVALGRKKLTADGSAIQGAFVTVDYDKIYESLLNNQNRSVNVIRLKEQFANKCKDNIQERDQGSEQPRVNLETTFSNFSNFETYFQNDAAESDIRGLNYNADVSSDDDDDNIMDTSLINKPEGITGAVVVDKKKLANTTHVLTENWPIFHLKGQLYRPNPVVVTLQRLPDQLIENMKAKPTKITLESTYYSAMTSYFDKRLPA